VLVAGVEAQSATALVVPSAEFPTLREAVAAAASGAVIRILPGVYELPAPVVISQKRLTIRGAGAEGPDRTELVGAAPPALPPGGRPPDGPPPGLLEFRDAGGTVQDLALSGSSAAVVGYETLVTARGRSPGQRLVIRRVSIRDTGAGILWRSTGRLTVNDVEMRDIRGGAIGLAPQGTVLPGASKLKFQIQGSLFTNIGDAAIAYVDDPAAICDPEHVVQGIIVHMSGPGVMAIRSGVCVLDSKLVLNKVGAVISVQAAVHVENTLILNPLADNGAWGDGVIAAADAAPSAVTIVNTEVRNAERAGISNFGSHVTLAGTGIACAGAFAIEGENYFGLPFSFDTGTPENRCSCPAPFGFPIPPGQCIAVSQGVDPPGPIAP
jgi:hypothetical protein